MENTDTSQPETASPHVRRKRYKGTHPRRFADKYKELNPGKYAEDIEKIMQRGHTPAGMHRSICVNEILEVLDLKPGDRGLDATLGYGGHTRELLKKIIPGGHLISLDVDPIELPKTEARLRGEGYSTNVLEIRKMNFAGINKLLPDIGDGLDFVLADLGLSSMQIDNPSRGFTFKVEGPLDLRMNPDRGRPASDLIKNLSEPSLEKLLTVNSDEPWAKEIAREISASAESIVTTTDLSDCINKAIDKAPHDSREKNIKKSCQRTFQALRIEVNDEFSALDQFLRQLPWILKQGGKAAILTFHSGEDNRVVRAFEAGVSTGLFSGYSVEPIRASAQERFDNPRSKCARLRWAIKS